jgi:hypothetical protein
VRAPLNKQEEQAGGQQEKAEDAQCQIDSVHMWLLRLPMASDHYSL